MSLVRCKKCPLYLYCITQKGESESCDSMVQRYNANLLRPPEDTEEIFQES